MSAASSSSPPASAGYSIGVISDTHGLLPRQIFTLFEGVDLIIHAGDIGRDDLLIDLGAIAPVRAVSGNVDGVPTRERPLTLQLITPAGKIAVTHGHLAHAPSYDPEKMLRHFAEFAPDILIYGHSHIPQLRQAGDAWILNPGSAGHPRFGRGPSIALITVPSPGAPVNIELVALAYPDA
jgi:putative phosphoesterase